MSRLNSKSKTEVKGIINATIPIPITREDIDYILSTAMDGGIDYWCEKVEVEGDYLGEYASEQVSRGGTLRFYLIEPISDNDPEYFTMNCQTFIKGIAKWFADFSASESYGNFISNKNGFRIDTESIDSLIADIIVQYVLFGEEVFA